MVSFVTLATNVEDGFTALLVLPFAKFHLKLMILILPVSLGTELLLKFTARGPHPAVLFDEKAALAFGYTRTLLREVSLQPYFENEMSFTW